jgi:catechol 2,3-dioxygenase-like lactoylglutathione lyase family enzyme
MTIQRIDNVGIFVDDLDAVIEFFVELGMKLARLRLGPPRPVVGLVA